MKRKGGGKHGCSLDVVRGCHWGSCGFAVGNMMTRCAWCASEQPNVAQEEETEPVSHGICDRHVEQVKQEVIEMKRRQGVNV